MIDSIVEKSIEKRIAELEEAKPQVIAELNAIAGALGELKKLLLDLQAADTVETLKPPNDVKPMPNKEEK